MAESHAFKQQYGYQQNSNLVLQVDRQLVDKRAKNEATGEVKSLVGRLGVSKMGDRAVRTGTKEKEHWVDFSRLFYCLSTIQINIERVLIEHKDPTFS